MKIGDLVVQTFNGRMGLVIDIDLSNNDAFVKWETKVTWSEIEYLEVVS